MPIEDVLIDALAVNKAALRAFLSDPDFDTLLVGDDAGLTGAVAAAPVKVVGANAMVSLVSTDTASNTEGAIPHFQFDDAVNLRKYAVLAFTVPDRDDQSGYGGANLHLTKLTDGVPADDFMWFAGGGKGIKFFNNATTAADLPGDKIASFNGDISVVTGFNVSAPQFNQIVGQNSQHSGITMINNSTQTSASERLIMGNNATTASFTIETFGGAHATKPSHVELVQQANVPLSLGTNGALRIVIAAGGGVKINSLAGTGTRNVVVDASGNLTAP